MSTMKRIPALFIAFVVAGAECALAGAMPGSYNQGLEFYKAGRKSEAIDYFEKAVKQRDHEKESRDYIDRIRKETVEVIRNKALTGVAKTNWQSKFYFINTVQNHIQVGISVQELFEHGSLNFRPGAVEALSQIAATLTKTENARVDVQLISELAQENQPDPQLTSQQSAEVFSYLALATRGTLPKLNS